MGRIFGSTRISCPTMLICEWPSVVCRWRRQHSPAHASILATVALLLFLVESDTYALPRWLITEIEPLQDLQRPGHHPHRLPFPVGLPCAGLLAILEQMRRR